MLSMSKWDKFRVRLMGAQADNNIDFDELCRYVELLGFVPRPSRKSSHHIYTRDDVLEIINLQPDGSKAHAYQVKQVRELISRYQL